MNDTSKPGMPSEPGEPESGSAPTGRTPESEAAGSGSPAGPAGGEDSAAAPGGTPPEAQPSAGWDSTESDGVRAGTPPRQTERRRRIAMIAGISGLVLAVILLVLWQRCGIRGCPDVDKLRGYMPEEASVVLDRNGEEIAKLFVTRRVVIGLDSLPQHVPDAFIAIEDQRFWDHGGVDWRRVVGAGLKNVRSGGVEEGASTITMQLARNVFPDELPASQKTIFRKIGEARVAREIESRYTKEEILELYVNQIYFGEGAWGIEAAAQEYYGKSATELTLAEAATLAALPRAPSRLNPRVNPTLAREERGVVLDRMLEQGLIDADAHEAAKEEELALRRGDSDLDESAPYFIEAVRQTLEEQLGDAIYTRGYRIHTTLDVGVQSVLEEELAQQARAIESGRYGGYPHPSYASVHGDSTTSFARGTPYLQTAGIIMDPTTGDVLALVGGRDYDDSEYNRATQAKRQPGSAFKPFVYASAISSGYSPSYQLVDRPIKLIIDRNTTWEPRNYSGGYSGVVTLREALVQSKNVATVRLSGEVGLSRVIGMAEQMGLGNIPSHPSVVLGTSEVTPLQLASAYTPFATLGQRTEPRMVVRVVDRDGAVVWAQEPNAQRVLSPAVAYITTNIMQDVVNRGTGSGVRAVGFRGPAAGKTGTTQDAADVWFVGFTPRVLGVIWYGMDERQRILRGATGGEIAAPVWGRIMRQVAPQSGDWAVPAGVETREVDQTGSIAGAGCPTVGATRTEFFLSGTAPIGECYRTLDYYQTAWSDSLGDYTYDEDYEFPYDTTAAESDESFWRRLRERVLGEEDSAAVRRSPTVTLDTVPESREAPREQRNPRVLGTPVQEPPQQPERRDTPASPPPAQRDTSPAATPPVRRDTSGAQPYTSYSGSV